MNIINWYQNYKLTLINWTLYIVDMCPLLINIRANNNYHFINYSKYICVILINNTNFNIYNQFLFTFMLHSFVVADIL